MYDCLYDALHLRATQQIGILPREGLDGLIRTTRWVVTRQDGLYLAGDPIQKSWSITICWYLYFS
jgi:hypothetical protein